MDVTLTGLRAAEGRNTGRLAAALALQPSIAMHVLREGGEYLRGRERRLWWGIAGCGIGLACCGNPLCELRINWARATVVRYSELIQVLREMSDQRRMPEGVARRLAETLARSQAE